MTSDTSSAIAAAEAAKDGEGPLPVTNEPAAPVTRKHPNLTLGYGFSHFGGLGIWALFTIIFAIWTPSTFLTTATVQSIAGGQAITGMLALAVLIPLAAGVFDLSVAQNLGLAAVASGALMSWSHVNPFVACLITLLMGAGVGIINGLLVAVVGVNSFIATLGMTSVLAAATEAIAKGQYIGPFPSGFQKIGSVEPLGIPIVTIYLFALGLLVWWLLEHSPVGRRTYATGAGVDAARLAGVRTSRYVFWTYVICGIGSSLAGLLLAAQVGSVSQDVGPPYLLPAYAACFLGATQLKPGRFNVWGTIVALYLLATGVKGLQLVGAATWITDLFNGVALVVAVSLVVLGQKARSRRGGTRVGAVT